MFCNGKRWGLWGVACFAGVMVTMVVACEEHATAVAKCGGLEAFQSRVGVLNVPQAPLGTIIAVNKKTRNGFPAGILQPAAADKVDSPPLATLTEKFEAKLSITITGDLPQAVQASIGSLISDATTMTVNNSKRTSIKDPIALINADANIRKRLRQIAGQDVALMVVSAIISADKINIGLDNSIKTNASANVVKYGNFSLAVSYQCSNFVEMAGQQFGAFFKVTPIAYDHSADQVVLDASQDIDLSQYNLTNGIRLEQQ